MKKWKKTLNNKQKNVMKKITLEIGNSFKHLDCKIETVKINESNRYIFILYFIDCIIQNAWLR